MVDLVRVKDPSTGHEYTTSALAAQVNGLTVLPDKPALDSAGQPLPGKPNETIADAANRRAGTKPATNSQEA